jgi:hypothetical protein
VRGGPGLWGTPHSAHPRAAARAPGDYARACQRRRQAHSPRRAHAPGDPGFPPPGRSRLLLVPALDARLLQQLTVLLLGHTLTALLDDRAHQATTLLGTTADGHAMTLTRRREAGHTPEARQLDRLRERYRSRSPLAYPVLPTALALPRHCRTRHCQTSRCQMSRPPRRTDAPDVATVPVLRHASGGRDQTVPTKAARRY